MRNEEKGTGSFKNISLRPTEDLGYFCGLVLGDGSLYVRKKRRYYVIRLETTDSSLLACFVKVARKLGLNPRIGRRRRKRVIWGKFYDQTFLHVRANSKVIYEFLRRCKLPDYHWQYPQKCDTHEFARGFLRGMFDADGSVDFCNGAPRVSLVSKHRENLNQIQSLLSSLGIYSSMIANHPNASTLRIIRRSGILTFYREVGFGLERKQMKLEKGIENKKWLNSPAW